MDSIEKFFLPPCKPIELPEELQESGERSTLHLLRRDLENLYLEENDFGTIRSGQHKAPYLASMGILTGLDLMAKFFNSSTERNRETFTNFLTLIGELSTSDATFMWEFRNALHHSYSLALKSSRNIIFTTEVNNFSWHIVKGENHIINLWNLKLLFLNLAKTYKTKLLLNEDLKSKFYERYNDAGCIFVQGQKKRPGVVPEIL